MSAKVKYQKIGAQNEFHGDDETSVVMFAGGLGSGKTYSLVMKALKLSYLNKNIAGGFLCPNFADYRKDVYPTFTQILQENKIKYKYHQTYKTFMFPWSKAPLYIFTGEKPIAGPNLGYCLINEFSLMKYERIKEMIRRVRVKGAKSPQKCFAGTPEDVFGWLEEFIEAQTKQGPKKFKLIHGDTRDNIHLSDDYFNDLSAMLDPTALKVFTQGLIMRIGGDYFYYAFDRKKNLDESVQYNPSLPVLVGADFNVGKMAATLSHKVDNKLLLFDEIFLTQNASDTHALARAIKERVPVNQCIVTIDASGSARKSVGMSDKQILLDHGFHVRHKATNPGLRDRQLLMNGKLSHGEILINPRCKNTIKDLEKVQQNKVDFTKVKTKDENLTHLSDTLDYVCDYEFTLFKPKQIKVSAYA